MARLTSTSMMLLAAACGFACLPAAAHADAKQGVDAWSRGDFATAVAEWQPLAAQGDADALFNLAQAYRFGKGVDQDMVRAEVYYARAAAKGHLQAADVYGLMLFQDPGRREQALPYVQDASRRGDPRAQYLLGVAHFNGDHVPTDWVRAYALLTLANAQGLSAAANALAQMDETIPLTQRQTAQSLAAQLQREAESARALELAAADFSTGTAAPAVTIAPPADTGDASQARAALADARQASGTASPSGAGADYAGPAVVVASAPVTASRPTPAAPARSSPVPAERSANGPWKVQLGAFGVASNAEKLWSRLAARPELAGRQKLLLPTGRVTRLLAGGYASQDEANKACAALKRAGQDCLVTSK